MTAQMKTSEEIAREAVNQIETDAPEFWVEQIAEAIEADRAQRASFDADELRLIRDSLGTVAGGWELTEAETALWEKVVTLIGDEEA